MKPTPRQSLVVALFLFACLSLLVAGCMGGGQATTTPQSETNTQGPGQLSASSQTVTSVVGVNAEALSTFKTKDPFIQQAVPPTTTTTASPGSTSTTVTPGSTSTTYYGPTTTYHGGSTTTTAHPTTTTTALHRHSLKILSVGVVGSSAAVTLKVDSTIYKDKRVGDVMSTSWGQVKVLDLSTASKVATILHGSETLVLTVGMEAYE
jgi:hypothetical protein